MCQQHYYTQNKFGSGQHNCCDVLLTQKHNSPVLDTVWDLVTFLGDGFDEVGGVLSLVLLGAFISGELEALCAAAAGIAGAPTKHVAYSHR